MQGSGRGKGGMKSMIAATDEKPKVTIPLLKRVLKYALPYRFMIISMLVLILVQTAVTVVNPLIMRDLIDRTIPQKNFQRLILLALAMLLIPMLNGGFSILLRRLTARVGEGVIFDLRVALYAALQRMSLRFFTNTKVGELMSRLNNDVIGAQNAISNTIVGIITNLIQGVVILTVMLSLEWRLTLISIVILPLFILAARLMGTRLRDIARKQMEANAHINALMGETLNIGGALLVKLFGRTTFEVDRFSQRAESVRSLGVQRAFMGSIFITIIGLLTAVGTAIVYGLGGYYVIQGQFTIGTIVALGAYLGTLYSALQGLANAPVEFATSMVSFERVFEVIDLPVDIPEKEDAIELKDIKGRSVLRMSPSSMRLAMNSCSAMCVVMAVLIVLPPSYPVRRKQRKTLRWLSTARRAGVPWKTSLSEWNRVSLWRWLVPAGLVRPRSPISSRACTIQPAGSSASTGIT